MASDDFELARPPQAGRRCELRLQHAAGFILVEDAGWAAAQPSRFGRTARPSACGAVAGPAAMGRHQPEILTGTLFTS